MAIINGNAEKLVNIGKIVAWIVAIVVAFVLVQSDVAHNKEAIADHEVRLRGVETAKIQTQEQLKAIDERTKEILQELKRRK